MSVYSLLLSYLFLPKTKIDKLRPSTTKPISCLREYLEFPCRAPFLWKPDPSRIIGICKEGINPSHPFDKMSPTDWLS